MEVQSFVFKSSASCWLANSIGDVLKHIFFQNSGFAFAGYPNRVGHQNRKGASIS